MNVAPDVAARLRDAESVLARDPRAALRDIDGLLRTRADGLSRPERALAIRLRGHARKALGRHEAALTDYAKSRSLFLRDGERLEAARTFIGRVDALMYLDRFAEARAAGRKALREFRELRDPVRAGRLLMNLGNLEHRRDHPARALTLYRRARAALRARVPPIDLAFVDYNVANVLFQIGDVDAAERTFRRVRRRAEKDGHDLLGLHVDYAMAWIDATRGRHSGALRRLAVCERGFAEAGHDRGRLNSILARAEIYRRLSLEDECFHAAAEAEHGFRRLGLRMESARALFFRGLGALGTGARREGRADLRRAARELRKLGNRAAAAAVDLRLAQSRDLTGRPQRGTERALGDAERELRHDGLRPLALEAALEIVRADLARGRLAACAARLGTVARAVDARTRPDLAARLEHMRALVAEQRGDPRAAARVRACLRHLARVRERLGAAELLAAHGVGFRDMYRDLFRVLAGRDASPEEIFRVVEAVDPASGDRASRRSGGRVAALRERLATLTFGLRAELPDGGSGPVPSVDPRAIRRAERALLEELRRRRIQRADGGGHDGRPRDVARLRAALAPGEVWIEFFDQGDTVGALALSRDGIERLRPDVLAGAVAEELGRLQYHVEMHRVPAARDGPHANVLRRGAESALEALGQACVPTLAPVLRGARRLLVRPAAGLDAVPWGALPWQGTHLWDRCAISLVPGMHTFLRARRSRARDLFADPHLWAVGGSDLPAASREARAIASLLGTGSRFEENACTRESFLRHAGRATLLHFAGHATFRRDNPVFSSLRLRDADVTFLDIEDMRIRAGLVVLGACRTGASAPGLGLGAGLTRGFLAAGARNLLVSLWPVGDRETADLMRRLYGAVVSGDSPSEALRRAAREGRDAGWHAADWAAFQTVGVD